MKTTTPYRGLKPDTQRAAGISRWILWTGYLLVAAVLFVLWFVSELVMLSYLFGGWMMIGAIALWLIEDAAEY
jgi:hypothetical protein